MSRVGKRISAKTMITSYVATLIKLETENIDVQLVTIKFICEKMAWKSLVNRIDIKLLELEKKNG